MGAAPATAATAPCTNDATAELDATLLCTQLGTYTLQVPAGAELIQTEVAGGGGGAGGLDTAGGNGALTRADYVLPAGTERIQVIVGAGGSDGRRRSAGGGGGGSAVIALTGRGAVIAKLAIAGGGGGAGGDPSTYAYAGNGGNAGAAGDPSSANSVPGGAAGVGGTGGAGGQAGRSGSPGGSDAANSATVARGGQGAVVRSYREDVVMGGNGGGGFGGGGGGAGGAQPVDASNTFGGGGGGSSYVANSLTVPGSSPSVGLRSGSGGAGAGSAGFVRLTVTGAQAPDAPTNVSATAGNARATASFTAPTWDGGAAVSGYTVQASSATGVAASATCAASPCAVTGLTNGADYVLRVAARNSAGLGELSAPSSAVRPSGPPDVPTNAVATPGAASAKVYWTEPANDGGSPITGYVVQVRRTGSFSSVSCSASPCTVNGLINGASYTFAVSAQNALGSSGQSALSRSVVPVAVPPAPTGVSAVAGPEAASVSFTQSSATRSRDTRSPRRRRASRPAAQLRRAG